MIISISLLKNIQLLQHKPITLSTIETTREVYMKPVTQNEYSLPDDVIILSTSDLQGNITSFNQGFVDASGYSKEEVMGKPHSMLRHPDMPAEAFKDLWNTISDGRP
jgi:PAS domain-containing protein